MGSQQQQEQQHFLVVTYPLQGHINPSLHLAKRLARTTAFVTFSTTVSAHRRMFHDDNPVHVDDLISYVPFSDGWDQGFDPNTDDPDHFLTNFTSVGPRALAALARRLSDDGRPVTCIIYSLLLPWAANVARDLSVPSVLYWIQPATVFAMYYHYFHGYDSVISAHADDPLFQVKLPGLPEFHVRDLPSFFGGGGTAHAYSTVLMVIKKLFENFNREKGTVGSMSTVLTNTFAELEADAIAAVSEKLDLVPIGPLMPPSLTGGASENDGGDLFMPDEKRYMEWLDTKDEGSVVYVSFGSISLMNKRQTEEILKGLEECGRPYLWVLRKDNRSSEGVAELVRKEGDDRSGMVVEWCSQVSVLSHKAVGCFVTHCGWNSTVETLVCGVPTVCVPQWTDQGTNARLMEATWGTGVRGEVGGDGVLPAEELVRCLEVVMGEEEEGKEIRRMAATWKERAWEAIREGGSSDQNLKAFVEDISKCSTFP